MITFTSDSSINMIPPGSIVYNLSSFNEVYYRLDKLNPVYYFQLSTLDMSSSDFNNWYAQFILSNEDMYKEFIGAIMMNVHMNNDVYILINPQFEASNLIVEALTQLIYTRYGYICNVSYDLYEDFDCLIYGELSVEGVVLLDREIDIYTKKYLGNQIMENNNAQDY